MSAEAKEVTDRMLRVLETIITKNPESAVPEQLEKAYHFIAMGALADVTCHHPDNENKKHDFFIAQVVLSALIMVVREEEVMRNIYHKRCYEVLKKVMEDAVVVSGPGGMRGLHFGDETGHKVH